MEKPYNYEPSWARKIGLIFVTLFGLISLAASFTESRHKDNISIWTFFSLGLISSLIGIYWYISSHDNYNIRQQSADYFLMGTIFLFLAYLAAATENGYSHNISANFISIGIIIIAGTAKAIISLT